MFFAAAKENERPRSAEYTWDMKTAFQSFFKENKGLWRIEAYRPIVRNALMLFSIRLRLSVATITNSPVDLHSQAISFHRIAAHPILLERQNKISNFL